MSLDSYSYHGTTYTWYHEPQNEYESRHISIHDYVHAIENCKEPMVQDEYEPPRWKHIGLSSVGIITVITDGSDGTAWHSSAAEVKLWLSWN